MVATGPAIKRIKGLKGNPYKHMIWNQCVAYIRTISELQKKMDIQSLYFGCNHTTCVHFRIAFKFNKLFFSWWLTCVTIAQLQGNLWTGRKGKKKGALLILYDIFSA